MTQFTEGQIALLQAPLDSRHVVKPTGGSFGPKGDYLAGWHVIAELNRIFGFDGWSYAIELRQDALAKADDKDQWQAAYTCICTLRVGEVTRQDVGFGSGFAKGIGDAIEGATKEAATDALKRCARTFGNPFGLALYDKSRSNVSDGSDDILATMKDAILACETQPALKKWWDANSAAIPDRHYDAVLLAFNNRLAAVKMMDTVAA